MVTDWQTELNKTRPLTFENLTVLRRQAQTKKDRLTTFQIFHIFFSGGDLNHNQNVKQKVSAILSYHTSLNQIPWVY